MVNSPGIQTPEMPGRRSNSYHTNHYQTHLTSSHYPTATTYTKATILSFLASIKVTYQFFALVFLYSAPYKEKPEKIFLKQSLSHLT
jgi:hypothetical protein